MSTFTYTIRDAATGVVTTHTGKVKYGDDPKPSLRDADDGAKIVMRQSAQLETAAIWTSDERAKRLLEGVTI